MIARRYVTGNHLRHIDTYLYGYFEYSSSLAITSAAIANKAHVAAAKFKSGSWCMTSSKCCNWLFKRACAFPLDGHQYGDFPFFWILFPTYPMPKRYTAVDPFKIHPLTLGACGCQLGACGCHFWNMVLLLPPLSWAPVAASLAPVAAGGEGSFASCVFFRRIRCRNVIHLLTRLKFTH